MNTTPRPPAEHARRDAWIDAVAAYRKSETEPSEETAADLGVAVHRYSVAAGLDTETAMKKVRDAVHGQGPKRPLYIAYFDPAAGDIGVTDVVTPRILKSHHDVMTLQDEVRKLLKRPQMILTGWSRYDD
jgi:hypothetical protein